MHIIKYRFFVWYGLMFSMHNIIGYGEPTVNLGQTNILDGGPLIPTPGWYWRPYLNYYHANKFADAQGNSLGGVSSPHLNITTLITQFLYQSNWKILKGKFGLNFFLPTVLSSHIEQNNLGITTSGAGLGDLILGSFLQWEPKTLIKNTEITLTTRLALDV